MFDKSGIFPIYPVNVSNINNGHSTIALMSLSILLYLSLKALTKNLRCLKTDVKINTPDMEKKAKPI